MSSSSEGLIRAVEWPPAGGGTVRLHSWKSLDASAAVLGPATAGSVMLGGTALAWDGGGGAGTGGTANNNCVNVGIPIAAGNGVIGNGSATGASCSATANGSGGNG